MKRFAILLSPWMLGLLLMETTHRIVQHVFNKEDQQLTAS